MKKFLLFIIILFSVGTILNSCGPSEKEIREKIKKELQDSIHANVDNVENDKVIADNAFESSKVGTQSIEETLSILYNKGTEDGRHERKLVNDGATTVYGYRKSLGNEEFYKSLWVTNWGIPNNEKAKEVFEQGKQKYLEGYDDGWNF